MKKGLAVILIGIVLLAAGLGGLSIAHTIASTKEFVADGYILAPAEETVVSGDVCKQLYFSKGAKYREKYDERVEFENQGGGKVSLDTEQFLHYADGSLGSFSKGVLLNVQDIDLDQLGYYSITKNTILTKNGNNYEMSSRGEKMNLSEFVWKISDTDYMLVSSNVVLHLGNSSQINLPQYAQIKFVDSGIVRIIHEQGTYQTVSADTYLSTDSGAELNLSSKNFYVAGEKVLTLDSMAIDDNTYIEVDENLDSPELKIPTFKVINGKNGAAGIAGEDGVDGEIGEDGQAGLEGENGLEGADGGDGGAGAAGAEGDSGLMGYDGAPGLDGEDAQTAGGSDIVPVDLNARPTITMNAMGDGSGADSYDVTSSSAKMTLNMAPNDSLVSGTTKVTLYDRATMKPINTADNQEYLGSLLESGSAALNFSGLQADREYMVVVSGDYQVTEGAEAITGTFFTKVFKTDAMGVVLEKQAVTENSVSVKATVTASNVDNYNVEFYHFDENGSKQVLATYYNLSTSQENLVLSDTEPTVNRNGIFTIQSNYTYYAKLTGVVASNLAVNSDDSVVELKTLRNKPHKEGAPDVSVTAMVPTLTPNNRNRSMIMELEKLADPDNGITGYRYELLDSAEVSAAAASGTLADVVPVYTKTSDKLAPQTFSIREGDERFFVGRVIVLFDDNEKKVEYATSLSMAASVDNSSANLTVEFLNVNKTASENGRFDQLSGEIKVSDNTLDLSNSTLLQYISIDTPMKLTITGEYEDVYTIDFENTDNAIKEDGFWIFPFSKDGLRANATYTLVVHGPCETDMQSGLSEPEKKTYLAGMRGITPGVVPISLVSYSVNRASTAFARAINLTRPVLTASDAPEAYYEYEATTLGAIEFGLFYVGENGVERQIGNNAKLTDGNTGANHGSDFYDSAWVSRDVVVAMPDGSLTVDVMNANTSAEAKGYVLTPSSFGLDNNDSIFFAGGSFYIRALNATDYSGKNVIPFKESEDRIVFTVEKRHVQAMNPNLQVDTTLIPNEGAQSTYARADLAEDTIVGIRLYADYPYADIKELRYYIYELDPSDPATEVLDGADGSGSKLFYSADAENVTGEKGLGELVLIGTRKGGNDGGWTVSSTDLYFEGTQTPDSLITWTKADGSTATGYTILERGKRYYVRYEVTADCGQVDCGADDVDDVYPNCAYTGDAPYYRSAVLEIEKQLPMVERYPGSSTSNSYTWNYRIVDPDSAVVCDASNKVQLVINEYSSVEAAAAGTGATTTNTEIELSDTGVNANAFSQVVVSGTAGKYHTVSVPYRIHESAQQEYLVSAPVLIKATLSGIGDIRAQGLLATSGTPEGDKVTIGGTVYEKALVNEGGYRYRLTLRGNGIKNCAALQVIVSGNANGTDYTAVYDPVYFEVIGEVTEGGVTESYAYAYLDASPLKPLKDAGVTAATVSVAGYYTTGEVAMDQFVSGMTDYPGASLDGEAVFAVKKINATGLESYVKWSAGQMNEIANGVPNGSLVIPGITAGAGLNITMGTGSTGSTAEFSMRWPLTALSVSAEALGDSSKCKRAVALDMNGLTEMTNYYSVEKLAKSGSITFADASFGITVPDILPAVKKDTITQGARSVFLEMETVGAGAQTDSSVYARISKVSGATATLLKLEQKTEEGITYYQVVDGASATMDDYSKANFGSQKLPIRTEGTRILTDARIRGLEMNTEYQVVFFSYDANGAIMDLFSIDGQRTSYPYVVQTLTQITINVTEPGYTYNAYADKTASVRFAIPGDEGTGMQIKYEVFRGQEISGTPLASGDIAPLGNTGYQYYSQDASKNNPIALGMNPGSGPLSLGSGYTVRVYAVDTEAGTVLGETVKSFTTPGQLKEPTFMVQTSQKKDETDSTKTIISARVVSTDTNRSILQDQYTLTLYQVDGTNLTPVDTRTVTRNAVNTDTRSIDFSSVAKGYGYVVKLIANIDTTNDGVAEDAITQEYTIAASNNSSATIGASATKTQLTLVFDNTQSFTQVTDIVLTVFDSNATQVYSTTITGGPFVTTDPGSFTQVLDWGTSQERAEGWYTLQLQYRDALGNVLGNNEAMVQVGSSGATGMAIQGLLVFANKS